MLQEARETPYRVRGANQTDGRVPQVLRQNDRQGSGVVRLQPQVRGVKESHKKKEPKKN